MAALTTMPGQPLNRSRHVVERPNHPSNVVESRGSRAKKRRGETHRRDKASKGEEHAVQRRHFQPQESMTTDTPHISALVGVVSRGT